MAEFDTRNAIWETDVKQNGANGALGQSVLKLAAQEGCRDNIGPVSVKENPFQGQNRNWKMRWRNLNLNMIHWSHVVILEPLKRGLCHGQYVTCHGIDQMTALSISDLSTADHCQVVQAQNPIQPLTQNCWLSPNACPRKQEFWT